MSLPFLGRRRRLTDGYEALKVRSIQQCFSFLGRRRRLTDGYDNIRRLSDTCGHIYKKKIPCDFW